MSKKNAKYVVFGLLAVVVVSVVCNLTGVWESTPSITFKDSALAKSFQELYTIKTTKGWQIADDDMVGEHPMSDFRGYHVDYDFRGKKDHDAILSIELWKESGKIRTKTIEFVFKIPNKGEQQEISLSHAVTRPGYLYVNHPDEDDIPFSKSDVKELLKSVEKDIQKDVDWFNRQQHFLHETVLPIGKASERLILALSECKKHLEGEEGLKLRRYVMELKLPEKSIECQIYSFWDRHGGKRLLSVTFATHIGDEILEDSQRRFEINWDTNYFDGDTKVETVSIVSESDTKLKFKRQKPVDGRTMIDLENLRDVLLHAVDWVEHLEPKLKKEKELTDQATLDAHYKYMREKLSQPD